MPLYSHLYTATPYSNPINYAKEYPPETLFRKVALFQNTLHQVLYAFLNGEDLHRVSWILYPFWDRPQQKYLHDCLCEQAQALELPADTLATLRAYDSTTSKGIAGMLATGYKALGTIVPPSAPSMTLKAEIPFKKENYLRGGMRAVVRLKAFVEQHCAEDLLGFYIHGSMATLDTAPGSSDLDTLAIIRAEVLESPDRLLALRHKTYLATRYLYQADLLQHHGHFILAEHDLTFYPQSYFPFILFQYAMPLLENPELHFSERDCRLERAHDLWRTCRHLMEASVHPFDFRDDYRRKYFLQILLLLPAIYLQLDGRYTYKRDAFERCRKEIPENLWQIVDKASHMRITSTWQPWQRLLMRLTPGPNPRWVWLANRLLTKRGPTLSKDSLHLAERLADHILEKNRKYIDALAQQIPW